ncbi:MAG: HAD family phosphatase [Ginsengibacter sp.]
MNKMVKEIIDKFKVKAVIFDLDGTLIDNNGFHLKTWKKYLEDSGRSMSDTEFNLHLNGRTNADAIKYIYGKDITEEEVVKHTEDKEALYRVLYKPFIEPVKGLIPFLEELHKMNIPMAIATSGVQSNIDFFFENIPVKKYFPIVVNSSHIKKGKPDPEIYLKTASILKVDPAKCLVFEDAVVGLQSAQAAGMKVIVLTTTQTKEELKNADLIIDDFDYFDA